MKGFKVVFLFFTIFLLFSNLIQSSYQQTDDEEILLQDAQHIETLSQNIQPKVNENPKVEQIKHQEYDEEEFVGFEKLPKPEEQKKAKLIEELNINEELKRVFVPQERENYYMEIAFVVMITFYLIFFWIGKTKNEKIATAWIKHVTPLLSLQFTKLYGDTTNKEGLLKESHHSFRIKTTGRIHCLGAQFQLLLRKRHDLLSTLAEFFFPAQDQLKISVVMEDMETFVFALIKKKSEKKFRKDNRDVGFVKNATSFHNLPESLVCLSEIEELKTEFLSSIISILQEHESEFISMHFSDQGVLSSRYHQTLEFVFALPENPEKLDKLTNMTFFLIDKVAKFKASKSGKEALVKHRAKALEDKLKETQQEREELAQREKLEKEKAAFEKMTPEQQRRYEEKMQKKESKKRQPKYKILT